MAKTIGTVRASDKNDPNNPKYIKMCAITGDGLLKDLAEAVQELDYRAREFGYYQGLEDTEEHRAKLEISRVKVYEAMKAIEKAAAQ